MERGTSYVVRDSRQTMRMLTILFLVVGSITVAPIVAAEMTVGAGAPSPTSVRPALPPINRPVMFNTPEADRILEVLQVFPPDNPWNEEISQWAVHSNSQNIIASIGAEKPLRYNPDMAFILVPPDQKRVSVKILSYAGESDIAPFPITDNLPIEGWPASYKKSRKHTALSLEDVQRDKMKEGGDRHAIIVDPVNLLLFELYQARKTDEGWVAAQTSIFNLKSNKLRPDGWTSTDAAGLPIFPAIVRYDELQRGMVEHAMRVTVKRSRRAYVSPATHFASRLGDPNLPRMGERLRLKQDFDVTPFSPPVQAILKGLKKHGMFVADNGIDWAISVAPDERIPLLHENSAVSKAPPSRSSSGQSETRC